MTSRVDLGEVQGNVVRTYGMDFCWARYGFFKVDRLRLEARYVVARWLAKVTFGDPAARRAAGSHSGAFVNISFTYRGLEALGIPDELLDDFPKDFRQGAAERASRLQDHWTGRKDVIALKDADLMLSVHSQCASHGADRWRELTDINALLECPLEPVHILDAGFASHGNGNGNGEANENGNENEDGNGHGRPVREAFGFADGLSQPAIQGVDIDAVGDGVFGSWHPRRPKLRRLVGLALEDLGLLALSRSWRLIRTGEFLLGYENEDGDLPEGSRAPLGPNSTFMVYREIDQDIGAFQEYVTNWAPRFGLGNSELRAKIVGRWPNGTPAVRPHPDPDDVASDRRRSNDFLYADDPSGFGCPLGAHTRRANPRDALPGGAEETMRHRIIRRGMPYEHVPDTDGSERQGLAFVCFNASICNGFEFIQRNWINDGQAFGLGSQRDFLLQEWDKDEAPTKMVIEGFRPTILEPPHKPFVRVRGCEYLFVPSRSACTWLAGFLTR